MLNILNKNKIKKIRKRDDRIVDFDENKIIKAIESALEAVEDKSPKEKAKKFNNQVINILNKKFHSRSIPAVEEAQDIIEEVLIKNREVKAAKAYIIYRDQHSKIREIGSKMQVDLVDQYLTEADWQVKENSNMAFSLQGLNNYISSEVTKTYWLNKIYPPEIKEAYLSGDFHIHDLGLLSIYCVGWDLQDILMSGFTGVSGKTESKPAKHFRAALGQIVNFMYTLQGEAAGAQALSNFDTLLAPFIRYDKLSYPEVKQAMQEFIFNMNVPTRVGFQSPYTNLTFDLTVPEIYAKQPAIIGGKLLNVTYSDFQEEMNMINKAFLEVMTEGDAKGRVFTFPIPTYNITKDFDWDNPIVDLLNEVTAKYGLPYFSNFVSSDMKPDDVRSMCKLPTTQIIYKNAEGEIAKTEIRRIVDDFLLRRNKIKVLINGEFKPVKDVIKLQLENEDILKVTLDNGIVDKMTIDHPSLIIKDGRLEMIESDKLKVGDEFPFAKNLYEGELGDFDLGRLVGLYIGDGWVSHKGATVNFAFNEKEDNLAQFVEKISEQRFSAKTSVFVNKAHHYIKISVASRGLAEIIKEYVRGDDSLNKRLNSKLFARRIDFRKGILFGIIESDGSVDKKKNRVVIHLGNKDLIFDISILSRSLGLNTTFYETKNRTGEKEKIGYSLRFSAGNLDWFIKHFGLKKGRNQKYNEYKDFYGVKIVKVEREKYTGYVYDFELDSQEHAFQLANGIITHNCCRLRLDLTELKKRGGGYFGANPLTGCYDEKTEILTTNGWKHFRNFTLDDEVFTLSKDNKIEIHKPVKLFTYDWNGDLYHFKAKSLDLLVTPNHKMVVDNARTGKRKLVKAEDFDVNNYRIPKQGKWTGQETKYFVLPEIENEWTAGNHQSHLSYKKEKIKILMDDWLKFFGFWLAEGSFDNDKIATDHGYRVVITQMKEKTRKEIKAVLERLPFYFQESDRDFVITNKQLWTYLKQFGHCYDKFIPKEIKKLSARQLKILFDWMVKGDGHIRPLRGIATKQQIIYYTVSKKLADDLQEVIMKIGWLGTMTKRKARKSSIKGREIKSSDQYVIGVQQSTHYRLRQENIKLKHYQGKVYSCEVTNHTLFVRRNGKCCWSGNSVGVVTINMPRLGYLSNSEKEFFKRLDALMVLAKNSLEIKRKVLEKLTDYGLYPYTKFYLRAVKKRFNEYWKNHFSTIGLLGLNEACLNLLGRDKNIGTPEGRDFAIRVLDFMRDKMLEFQKETGNIYNLEATPAEGTSYRLALKDKGKYPDIICANEEEYKKGADPFYTNSSQLPVDFTDDIFEALDLQDELQTKYTGGCVEGGNKVLTNKGLLDIKYIVENFDKLKPIKAISYNPKKEVGEWDKIVKAVKVDVKNHNKIRVLGERNLDITTSDWHPFFVLEKVKVDSVCPVCGKKVKNKKGFAGHLKWNPECREKYHKMPKYKVVEKRADELKNGDYILQNSNNLYPKKKTKLDSNLMWLIGFFIGDGYILKSVDNRGGNNLKKYTALFFSEHKKPLEKIVGILNKYFGCEVNIYHKDKRSAVLKEVSTSKKQALDFFFKCGFWAGKKVYDIYIPQEVKRNINKENVYALLSGLMDSDGAIGKRDGDFEYMTVSHKLADDILEMLTTAGILTSKKLKKVKRKNEKDIYRIRISQYQMSRIKDKLSITVNSESIKNNLSNRTKRYLPVVRVKKVSKTDVKNNQFYDLMTAKNHNYLAGNNSLIFIHNTTIHLFLGEKVDEPLAIKYLVKKICEKYKLPYFTITPSFSICPIHGYIAGEHEFCPICDQEIGYVEDRESDGQDEEEYKQEKK